MHMQGEPRAGSDTQSVSVKKNTLGFVSLSSVREDGRVGKQALSEMDRD